MAKRSARAARTHRAASCGRRARSARSSARAERRVVEAPERHDPSPTAVAVAALRTGVVPNAVPARSADRALPGEGRKLLVGDPDDDSLRNGYVGEETPGGSTPTPDQSDVDEIGLAYGIKEEDSGELRMSAEVLDRRDRRRRGVAPTRRRA